MKPGKPCRCGSILPDRKYRCDDCRRKRSIAREKRKHEARHPLRPCEDCWVPFRPPHGRGKVLVCLECRPIGLRDDIQRHREKEARWEKPAAPSVIQARAARAATKIERKKVAEEKRAARKAERMTQVAAKPWLAPGLSVAEKRRIRYRCDPLFNLSERVRIQMRNRRRFRNMEHTIRKAVAGKVTTPGIEKFVGYTMANLRRHLEAQFDDFMCWEAFADGSIHIDHKRPVSKFDLDDPDQVRACWALDNLQPLWSFDNMRKGARWRPEEGARL